MFARRSVYQKLWIPIHSALVLFPLFVEGGSATWNFSSSTNWNADASWTPNNTFPNAIGDVATFSSSEPPNNINVTLGVPITVGEILMQNANVIGVNGTATDNLTFQVSSGSASLTMTSGGFILSTPVVLSSPLIVTQSSSGPLTINSAFSGSGSLTFSGTGTSGFLGTTPNSYTGATFIQGGIVEILTGTNIIGISGDVLQITGGSLVTSDTGQLASGLDVTVNGGNLSVTGTQSIDSLVFQSGAVNGSGALTLNTTGAALTMYNTTADVSFTLGGASGGSIVYNNTNAGTAIITGTINLGGVSRIFTINHNASNTVDMSILQGISNGSISKQGAGNLNLTASNSYTGTTTITDGTLSLSGSGSISSSSGVSISNGATFDISGTGGATIKDLNGVTGSSITLGSQILTVQPSVSTDVFAGIISGGSPGGGLTISAQPSAGALSLSNVNTYTGPTTVTAGKLSLTGSGSISSSSGVSAVTGGTFDISGTTSGATIQSLNGDSASFVTLGSQTLTIDISSGTPTFAGQISGGGGLIIEGVNEQILSGANGYTGSTQILSAELSLSGSGSISSSSGVSISNGAAFDIFNTTSGATINDLNGVTGSFVTIGGNTLTVQPSALTTDTFAGVINDDGFGGSLTVSAQASTGVLSLSNVNAYSGSTQITAGKLSLTGSGSISSSSGVSLTASGATFDISGTTGSTIGDLNGVTGSSIMLGSNILTVKLSNGATDSFAGVISDASLGGGITVSAFTSSSTLSLSDVNTYTGPTLITGGMLSLSGSGSISSSLGVEITGGTFDISGTTSGATIQSLSGAGGGFVTLGSQTLTIDLASGSTPSFDGRISGTGGIILQGSGQQTFTGTSTYSGATQIEGGALFLLGSGSISPSSGVSLTASGTTFDVSQVESPIIQDLNGVAGSSINLGSSYLTVQPSVSTDVFAGVISDGGFGGDLNVTAQVNTGALTLTGVNTYTGGTTVGNGTLSLTGSGSISSSLGVEITGGTFDISGTTSGATIQSLTGNQGTFVTLGSQTLTIDPPIGGGPVTIPTYSGNITDSGLGGSVVINIPGSSIQFNGTNSYTGGTTVTAGTLYGDTNGLQGDILNNASLIFNQNLPNGTYAGVISGGGNLRIQSAGSKVIGKVFFSSAQMYTGPTVIGATGGGGGKGGGPVGIPGYLGLSGDGDISSSSSVMLTSSGTFDISGTNAGATVTNLSGAAGASVLLGSENLTVNVNTSSTFAGNITDSGLGGSLHVTGGSSFILTGTNSYSGGTTVDSLATLQGVTGSIQGNILNNGALIFGQIGSNTYSSSITGNGNLTIQNGGSGTPSVNFTGNNSQRNVSVNGINMSLNGNFSAGSMVIANNASLGGTGTITGNVNVQGTLAPGNSIGTMNVVGNVNFASGSTFDIELSETAHDLLNITGGATIQPGSTLNLTVLGALTNGVNDGTDVIIQTTSGVSGTFSNVVTNYPLLAGTLTYTPLDVELVLNFLPFKTLVGSGNAGAVATYLDGQNPAPGSDLSYVLLLLQSSTSAAQLENSLNQLQPALFNAIFLSQENTATRFRETISRRVYEIAFTDCKCNIPREHTLGIWVDAQGDLLDQNSTTNQIGFRSKTGAAVIGFDKQWGSQFITGVSAGYGYTDIDWRKSAEGSTQNYNTSVYGSWFTCNFLVDASFTGAYLNSESKRSITFLPTTRIAKHTQNSWLWDGHLEVASSFDFTDVYLSPFIMIDYMEIYQGSFRESGASSINLEVKRKKSNLLRSEAGVRFSRCFATETNKFIPTLSFGVVRESRFTGRYTTSKMAGAEGFFTVVGYNPSRTLLAPGADITFLTFSEHFGFNLSYGAEIGRKVWDQNLSLRFDYNW